MDLLKNGIYMVFSVNLFIQAGYQILEVRNDLEKIAGFIGNNQGWGFGGIL